MIRITDKSVQVVCKFPKNRSNLGTNHLLKLHSDSTKNDYSYNLTDEGNLNDYYEFQCDFSNVPDGEYRYTISSNRTTVASGLILIGVDYDEERVNNNITYEDENGYIIYGE